MTPLQLMGCLFESHDYSSTDILLPPEIGDFLMEWNELNIPEDVLHSDEDGGKGRELEPHCTVKYGLIAQEVPPRLRDIVDKTDPFPIFLGVISLFTTSPEFDVVKIDVESPWLRRLNKRISASLPNEDTHPEYRPHVTLAYVKKGSCDGMEGDDPFKEGTDREFTASGIRFSGPGDGDDPNRVREMLMFTRSAPSHDPAKTLSRSSHEPVTVSEAVGPSQEELKQIEQIIRSAAADSAGDVALFVAQANDQLEPYRIIFAAHPENRIGAPAMATPQGCFIAVPGSHEIRSPEWPRRVMAMVYHELVHVRQMGRSEHPEVMYQDAQDFVAPGGRLNHDNYLVQKQEVEAHAASMVDSWRRQNLNPDQMLRRLRSGNWGHGMKYWSNRDRFPKIFNRFCTYATEYINALADEKVSEAITPLDPFGQCLFPADPDRVKLFLRSMDKRRGSHTIT